MAKIPKEIYLQWFDEDGEELNPTKDEITWCIDRINETDVSYARQKTIQALEHVTKAARIIYEVSKYPRGVCPHGVCPNYPAHAWWCDDCWDDLGDALASLDSERKHHEQTINHNCNSCKQGGSRRNRK